METSEIKKLQAYQIRIVRSKTNKAHTDARIPQIVQGDPTRLFYSIQLEMPETIEQFGQFRFKTKSQTKVISDVLFNTGDTAVRFKYLQDTLKDENAYKYVDGEVIFNFDETGIGFIARCYDTDAGFNYISHRKNDKGTIEPFLVNQWDEESQTMKLLPYVTRLVTVIVYDNEISEIEEYKVKQKVKPYRVKEVQADSQIIVPE
jgi:hypothetical protein